MKNWKSQRRRNKKILLDPLPHHHHRRHQKQKKMMLPWVELLLRRRQPWKWWRWWWWHWRWEFPQAFLNGCGHGACGARNTCGQRRRPLNISTSCHPFSCISLAQDPSPPSPNTLFLKKNPFHRSESSDQEQRFLNQLNPNLRFYKSKSTITYASSRFSKQDNISKFKDWILGRQVQ